MSPLICKSFQLPFKPIHSYHQLLHTSKAEESSTIAIQIFDLRKRTMECDRGFLGAVNIKVSDVIDLEPGGHSVSCNVLKIALDLMETIQKCSR